MKLSELLKHVPHVDVLGSHDPDITCVRELDDPALDINALRWWNGTAGFLPGGPTRHGAYIVPAKDMLTSMDPGYVIIRCTDPKASIIAALEALYPDWEDPPFATLQGNVRLLKSAQMPAAIDWPWIGDNSVIGGPGFGFHACAPHPADHGPATIDQRPLQRFPHIGGVRIGVGVEIGSNTCIDRGAIGDTVIGDHTKIDNLVHIAHNVRIGKRCLIVAGAVIGGSAIIGDDVFIGIGAHIRNKVHIGNGAIIGQGANVLRDVPPGETWIGNPARKYEK